MKRKVVQQGTTTLMVSLPSSWAKQHQVRKGGEIEIEPYGASLLISTEAAPTKKTITITITAKNQEDLQVLLTHAYRKGFDTIIVKGVDRTLAQKVTRITNNLLLGFEVTSETVDECVISNISEPSDEKYDVLVRRVFLIDKELIANTTGDVSELHQQLDRFVLFCRRVLVKGSSERDALVGWELLTFLTHIGHGAVYLNEYITSNRVNLGTKSKELLGNLKDYYQLLQDAQYKKDVTLINEINAKKKRFQFGKCYKYLRTAKGHEAVVLCHIRELFRLIQLASSPILSGLLTESNQ